MFPIYGCGAYRVTHWQTGRPVGSGRTIKPHGLDHTARPALYGVLILRQSISSGAAFNGMGMCPWNYTGFQTSVNGLIRLDFAPLWFATGLLF